jgi:hypothetical protein
MKIFKYIRIAALLAIAAVADTSARAQELNLTPMPNSISMKQGSVKIPTTIRPISKKPTEPTWRLICPTMPCGWFRPKRRLL